MGIILWEKLFLQKLRETVSGGITSLLKHGVTENKLKLTDVSIRVFWGSFWNCCTKNFRKYTAKRLWSFPRIKLHEYSRQPTTEPKTLQITFSKMLRSLRKIVLFSLSLQACSTEFPTSTENLLQLFSEIAKNLPGKGL